METSNDQLLKFADLSYHLEIKPDFLNLFKDNSYSETQRSSIGFSCRYAPCLPAEG
jgi:hypothetical protein